MVYPFWSTLEKKSQYFPLRRHQRLSCWGNSFHFLLFYNTIKHCSGGFNGKYLCHLSYRLYTYIHHNDFIILTDFMLSRKLIIGVNSVLTLLHRVVLGDVADVSEVRNAFI